MAKLVVAIQKESSEVDKVRNELEILDQEWAAAIVKNDADAIGRFMSDDWVIVGPQGNVIEKLRFLDVIKSGDLTHEAMESDDWLEGVVPLTFSSCSSPYQPNGGPGGEWKKYKKAKAAR
jgi:hypothetical protein